MKSRWGGCKLGPLPRSRQLADQHYSSRRLEMATCERTATYGMRCVQHKECTTVHIQEMHAYRYPSKAKGAETRFDFRILVAFTPNLDTFSVCNQLHQHLATHMRIGVPPPSQKNKQCAAATYLAIAIGWQLQQSPTNWQL